MFAARIPIRTLVVAALTACALVLVSAPADSTAQTCASASALAGSASNRALVRSTLCLLNEERAHRGMRGLHLNRRLSKASRRHARDMVRRYYFAHDSLGGGDFVDRIRRTGYLRSAGRWLVGENLAWGAGARSTPDATMRAWMESPPHRANILNSRFREIGIGVVIGAPVHDASEAATYATDFGRRG
jgi:uncharacterized protein YkwD